MQACPTCRRLYPSADAGFCQADGQPLVAIESVALEGRDADPRVGALYAGRYRVYRVVADGGMGRVYEALDVESGRQVAVKVLHRDLQRDAVTLERFKREHAIGLLLHHPHIVDVIDFFPTEDKSHALVMEYLAGEELRGLLRREGSVRPERVVRLLSQTALALEAAHGRGLVHRDLKPENIFLCRSAVGDAVKVLDFGSVKDTESREQLTVMGTAIGSPYYMSPEQAQGLDTVDQRTDVWALAAIAFEMLSGTVPFSGANGPAILFGILTRPPPPLTFAWAPTGPVPAALDRAIGRGLVKAASDRTASVMQLAQEVGGSLGLRGDPAAWAETSESELAAAITLDLAPAKPQGAEEAFFESVASLSEPAGLQVPPSRHLYKWVLAWVLVLAGMLAGAWLWR